MTGNWLAAVTSPVALWLVNVALLLVILAQTRFVVAGRSARAREQRSMTLAKAVRQLQSLPDLSDLVKAWDGVLEQRRMQGDRLRVKRLVLAACQADKAKVATLRETCGSVVNIFNQPAELIDEGLLRPKDLVREVSGSYTHLLVALTLVEPFVWFDSLVCGRGRWGYRPLQLREVLSRLRVVLPPAGRGQITVHLCDSPYVIEPPIPRRTMIVRRIGYKFRSPTINVRTKLRQRMLAAKMAAELDALSLLPTAHTDRNRPVDW